MSARREYGLALLGIALGGVCLLIAYGMPWGSAEVPLVAGADGPVRLQEFTGRDLFPLAAVAGWVSLAGLAAVVATRSWGRIAVAAVLLIGGLGGGGAAVAYAVAPGTYLDAAVRSLAGSGATVPSRPTAWWIVAVLGGLLVAVMAGLALARGRHWPALGARYERTSAAERELDAWQALDRGVDPTDDLLR